MTLQIDAIRGCFEGVIPGTIATADLDATPNIAYVSQVQYIDSEHVALSYQFFNKTRHNLLATRYAVVSVIDPHTAAHYRLKVEFLRTERAGPLFESMKAKLAGLASHAGMSDVFQLLGADVFRVNALERVPGEMLEMPPQRRNLLSILRRACERIRLTGDLEHLLSDTLACLEKEFGIEHAMALLYDDAGKRLYTLASRGYETSGVGSEIMLGDGVIGVAAREHTPIRISHTTSEYAYNRAIRNNTVDCGFGMALETEIPLPGLSESRSQLAVPIMAAQRLIGVLFVESRHEMRYSYDDEDALVTLAAQLGMAIQIMQTQADSVDEAPRARPEPESVDGEALVIKHFPENDSVFLGDDYLIKGVAGSIFAVLVADCIETGRTEFTNRELRLDARIRLPDVSDNLEARLLLLSRRLTEREAPVRIEKSGRGRFRLVTERPLRLIANCT
ncbi:MAG: GAF domain-containing protein [Pseudomonadota bacterium]